jgi:hypothetical protein
LRSRPFLKMSGGMDWDAEPTGLVTPGPPPGGNPAIIQVSDRRTCRPPGRF